MRRLALHLERYDGPLEPKEYWEREPEEECDEDCEVCSRED